MKAMNTWLARFALLLMIGVLSGCSLPSLDGRSVSQALSGEEARSTFLGRALAPQVQAHPGLSGLYFLADAHDAYAARVLLARAAERTLDVQSYIWCGDINGTLLMYELLAAADRGVRVRLLLDDNGTSGLDPQLAALHSHPNVEVRLFNPFVVRSPKVLGYFTDFKRANRRMHNKSFTADNQATIIGGRNVGDEYFGASSMLFADLDVLAVGPVVDEMSKDFDLYWASESSYPADLILPAPDQLSLANLKKVGEDTATTTAAAEYTDAVKRSKFLAGLLERSMEFEWAKTTMFSDDPAKGLGKATKDSMLISQLGDMLGMPKTSVDLVSPYFVPTAAGVEVFSTMFKDGVRVRVLTNSLDATDVAVVHAGYAKHREELLQAGVMLWEMRGAGNGEGGGGFGSGSGGKVSAGSGGGGSAPFGSSGSSLHAKTFAVDGKRVFVGSMNFDPRSTVFNTELGFMIESPLMARQIAAAFEKDIPDTAYEVRLSESGSVNWLERRDGKVVQHDTEPESGFMKRAIVWVLSKLPIEHLL